MPTTPSVGTLTSAGIGSGLDVNTLVSQLVAADRAPQDAQIAAQQSKLTTQLSAIGTLQGALSSFQSAVSALSSQSTFQARATTSSDSTVFTASAASTAIPGNYSIQVVNLASAQQLASNPFAAGASAVVGTGTLTLTQAGTSISVAIDSTDNTLSGIAAAINSASGNPGINASVVQTTGGARLVLTSANTGAAKAITVAASGGDGGLAQLSYDPAGTKNLTELQAAKDADVKVSTLDVTSPTNSVTGAIAGVTLNLLAPSANSTTQTLSVANDTATTANKVNAFVSAYNSLQKTMASLSSYDASTRTAAPLLGDPLLLGVQEQIQRGLFNAVGGLGGNLNSLAAIGITTDSSGQMQLDGTKLQAALSSNYDAVGAIFGSANGVAARLATTLNGALGSGGTFASRTTSLNTQMKHSQDDLTQLNARMAVVQANYMAQFTALDTLLTSLQSTSKFLTQQLAILPGAAPISTTSSTG